MGYFTLGILGFTALALFFGMLVGCLRGRNRALLRFLLLVLTVVLAFALRPTVTDAVLALELPTENSTQTVSAIIENALSEAFKGETPEAVEELCFALAEIAVGLVAFFLLFAVIRLVSWLILFPILKIFVRRGPRRRRGVGALIGLLQGALIAFVICAPITGIAVQAERLSRAEIDGAPLFEIPSELGIGEYLTSAPGKTYQTAGGWFFDLLTTAELEGGGRISIGDACDMLLVSSDIVNKVGPLTDSLGGITAAGASPEERVDALKGLGDSLIEIGESIDSLSGDAKELVEELLGALSASVGGEGSELPPEVSELISELDFDEMDLRAAGESVNAIASVIEKDGSEPITEEEASTIVDGIVKNGFLLDLIPTEEGEEVPTLIELPEADAATVESAISSSTLTSEQKDMLRSLLGISPLT